MKTYQKLGMVVAFIMSGSATADPVAIYDNISGLNTFGEGIPLNGNSFVANMFSTLSMCPGGCALGNVTLNLSSSNGASAGTSLQVLANINSGDPNSYTDDLPGEVLMTMNNPSEYGIYFENNTFTPNGILQLEDNTRYWLRLSSTSSSTTFWNYLQNSSVQGQPSLATFDLNGYANSFSSPNLLMKIEGTPIAHTPIPGAVWMMGTALLGFMTTRLRKLG